MAELALRDHVAEVRVQPYGTCSGVLRSADGEQVRRATVWLQAGHAPGRAVFGRTDAKGFFSLRYPGPGTFFVVARQEHELAAAGPLDPGAGVGFVQDLTLGRGAMVALRQASGVPLTLLLTRADGLPKELDVASGTRTIVWIPPGRWAILAGRPNPRAGPRIGGRA